MATIKALLDRFQNLDAGSIAVDATVETADQLADLNTEQMHKGFNAEGDPIGEYRSEIYAEEKHRMNPLPGFGRVDLRLTGAFYEGMYVRIEGDTIIEGSTDEKEEALQKKYGKIIFGLSAPFKREYLNEFLRPAFARRMQEAIGLKFGKS